MKVFTLETLAELTQELLNDPNLVHQNMVEKASIYGHAAAVLSAQRYAVTLENMSKSMISALKAAHAADDLDIAQAQIPSWIQLVSDELESLHGLASVVPESERTLIIPAWTEEELWAVRKDPPEEWLELAAALSAAMTPRKWNGCAHVLIKLEELAALDYGALPVWSTRRDLDELRRRLEWALATIKDQSSQ